MLFKSYVTSKYNIYNLTYISKETLIFITNYKLYSLFIKNYNYDLKIKKSKNYIFTCAHAHAHILLTKFFIIKFIAITSYMTLTAPILTCPRWYELRIRVLVTIFDRMLRLNIFSFTKKSNKVLNM